MNHDTLTRKITVRPAFGGAKVAAASMAYSFGLTFEVEGRGGRIRYEVTTNNVHPTLAPAVASAYPEPWQAIAEPSTQMSAIHAARSSPPSAWATCINITPEKIKRPVANAANGTLRRASRYKNGAHNMPAMTVNWKLPAINHDGPLEAANESST